ncbi:hypothetical protein CVT25_004558 [Psilocybe cyanescens]|uniref:Uncharacterized protein n=1 Tax=Psilocybe cyanescens TaxID=93625 RepID=A0A409XMH0_PSICY|nr:hypothetical protein CVT25_004558 [Psilocybe cyanescens]
MLPAPPNFAAGYHLPQFSLQNNFVSGSSYGPHPQPGYLSQALLQDPLHQRADPNSPEVFKNNIQVVHQRVHEDAQDDGKGPRETVDEQMRGEGKRIPWRRKLT